MINEQALKIFLKEEFPEATKIDIKKLGEGVQGAGFLVEIKTDEGIKKQYVIKGLFPQGLGHDYPSDRAGVFLLDLDEFKNLPNHVEAVDVLSEREDGSIKSIGGGKEYYLLMEKAEGKNYFNDLTEFALRKELVAADIKKIKAMTSYLAGIHNVKKESKALYWRKIRDTIGHGECLMGVFDTYPDGTITFEEMASIEKKCTDWRAQLKARSQRLCQIHGDFHPGNIWFQEKGDFVLLDRSRGPWGDAADDVTALTINYIFFSIKYHGRLSSLYRESLHLFYDEYVKQTGDHDLFEVVAPFYAFRGAVVANPVFYPDITSENRRKIFNFIHGVLDDRAFSIERVNEYIK
jgi:aminoglycoside phosphotransferase (APT) family kinase protein